VARQNFAHPPQHGATLVSSETSLWWCRRSRAQQQHEQKPLVCPLSRTSFGSKILDAPKTDTLSAVSGRVETYFA